MEPNAGHCRFMAAGEAHHFLAGLAFGTVDKSLGLRHFLLRVVGM
jgi:hypothetical protein